MFLHWRSPELEDYTSGPNALKLSDFKEKAISICTELRDRFNIDAEFGVMEEPSLCHVFIVADCSLLPESDQTLVINVCINPIFTLDQSPDAIAFAKDVVKSKAAPAPIQDIEEIPLLI